MSCPQTSWTASLDWLRPTGAQGDNGFVLLVKGKSKKTLLSGTLRFFFFFRERPRFFFNCWVARENSKQKLQNRQAEISKAKSSTQTEIAFNSGGGWKKRRYTYAEIAELTYTRDRSLKT